MRTLIYGLNFSPELTGIGKYTGEMAAWLAARGHDVRVVTAPPYYPDWKVGKGFRNEWTTTVIDCRGAGAPHNDDEAHPSLQAKRGNPGCLVVYRCPLWVPHQPGGIKRLLHLASFAFSSLPVLLRQVFWRPDVVWVVEPALFCAPAAIVVARLSGARTWLHVQDFEIDAAFELGLLRGERLRCAVTAAERWLMRRFDVVSTISKNMHQRLLNKGLIPANTRMATNWVNMADFSLPSPVGVAAYRAELGVDNDTILALYSGNMGGKQGLELLAQIAGLCLCDASKHKILFVFCGNGPGRADLVARCQGLSNVRFLDLQPTELLPNLLAAADIHLLPQRHDAADLVMPSKLTGMLASARPVVATAAMGTELADVITGGAVATVDKACAFEPVAACGVVVPPGDAETFAAAVQALAADALRREKLGSAGYLYAQAYLDRDAVLQRFESDLLALLNNAPQNT
jgi:colanic acid biosynthesis glycosyl transferase WcaI